MSKQKNLLREDGLTEEEGRVADALVYAWNGYKNLTKEHPSELDEFCLGIHMCQYQLMSRVMRRDYPKAYPTYENIINIPQCPRCKQYMHPVDGEPKNGLVLYECRNCRQRG